MLAAAIAGAWESVADTAPFSVLWLSPGAGGLHEQSFNRLSDELAASELHVHLLDVRYLSANQTIPAGSILVSQWEDLLGDDLKTGKKIKRLMKDGERDNLLDIIERTTDAGTSLVLIIDESHQGAGAERTEELLHAVEELTSIVRVEASATPKLPLTEDGRDEGRHVGVNVNRDDVIDAGMLKRRVIVNADFQDQIDMLPVAQRENVEGEELIVRCGWNRIVELRDAYVRAGSTVRPLLLVQLPNDVPGEEKRAFVEEWFAKCGITEANHRLAVWLDGHRSSTLGTIREFDSPVEVLLFKQALATGWDCPRAHVLVAFRDPRSETFAIQTVGRILRMPERQHYDGHDAELLNNAYVFSNIKNPHWRADTNDGPPVCVTSTRRDDIYTPFTLSSTTHSRSGAYNDVTAAVVPIFKDLADTAKLSAAIPSDEPDRLREHLVSDVELDTYLVIDAVDIRSDNGPDSVTVQRSGRDVQAEYDRLLATQVAPFTGVSRSVATIRRAVMSWFEAARPEWDSHDQELVQRVVIAHWDKFLPVIGQAVGRLAEDAEVSALDTIRQSRSTNDCWEPPTTDVALDEFEVLHPARYLYAVCRLPRGRSNPERRLEDWFEEPTSPVRWWWKNHDSGKAFLSIDYDRPCEPVGSPPRPSLFFPDFIAAITTATGNVIAVLETKSLDDPDHRTTAAKALRLRQWADALNVRPRNPADTMPASASSLKVLAGIVVPDREGTLWFHSGANYTAPTKVALRDTSSGWQTFSEVVTQLNSSH
jgi:type III restriction enzyme